MSTLNYEQVADALKVLRLHGFALVHYGGDALHQAVGAPTEGTSWRENLSRACSALVGEEPEAAWRLGDAIGSRLFDLNLIGSPGVAVAKAISEGTARVG